MAPARSDRRDAPIGAEAGATMPMRPPSSAAGDATLPAGAGRDVATAAAGGHDTAPSQPPADTMLAPGTMVHQFEIIGVLGRGGMGEVYLARDTRLARKVALKFLLTSSPELTQRFLIEARNTARCRHDNIVVIYDVDTFGDRPYMALEYLEGRPLAELIEGRPLPTPRAIEILAAVARALVRAHADGLVHCDLKPDNVVITHDGAVKVLDFGIARILDGDRRDEHPSGTPRYMSPEQWGVDAIDHRTDLWALGVIAWELLTGRHPLGEATMRELLLAAADLEQALPPPSAVAAGLPDALDRLVTRCLAKRKQERTASAAGLLAELEAMKPARSRARTDRPPYPGLASFDVDDADRFFGREADVTRVIARLDDAPLVIVAGPSGVGKSSLVRAGVVPALRDAGASWQVVGVRPGRDPLHALAAACAGLDGDQAGDGVAALATRLRAEPGGFGARLRQHARERGVRVLVAVDQVEELFTLTADPAVHAAFAAAVAGAGDDARAPVRIVLSIRSDFLDRVEGTALGDRLAEGLLLLRPLGPAGLRAALERPLDATGYRFEANAIIDDIVAQAGEQDGALPLIQFAAARLWDRRDRERRLLTRAAHDAMGGIAGALATHAEEVVRELPPASRALLRAVLLRLVTAEGTRAVVERRELASLGPDVDGLIDRLAAARLIAIGGDGEGATVELVHESLVRAWPTLRRWREEDGDDAALVAQVRTAAAQWDQRGRPPGLLWTGEAIDEVRAFVERHAGPLAPREDAFLHAGLALADRAARRRRRLVIGSFAGVAALAIAAVVVALWIGGAERAAQAERAAAVREATRARTAEDEAHRQLAAAQAAEQARIAAEAERRRAEHAAATAEGQQRETAASLDEAQEQVARSAEDLQATNVRLRAALAESTAARRHAEEQTRLARELAAEAERQRAIERKRADEAERKAAGLVRRLQ